MNLSIIHLVQTLKRLLEQLHHPVTRKRIPYEHGVALLVQKETVEISIFRYYAIFFCKTSIIVYIYWKRKIEND